MTSGGRPNQNGELGSTWVAWALSALPRTSAKTVMSTVVVAQARAEDHVVIETGVVRTSDLNLATPRGASVLLRRVTAKTADLCTQTASPLVRGATKAWRECLDKAVARTIAPIKAPLVTAEYDRVFGKPPSVVSSR